MLALEFSLGVFVEAFEIECLEMVGFSRTLFFRVFCLKPAMLLVSHESFSCLGRKLGHACLFLLLQAFAWKEELGR